VTTQPAVALNGLELDALTELVNVGVSRAAASLGTMVGSEVLLAVPAVEIVTYERATHLIGERTAGRLVAVYQSFNGDISGGALLLFPETTSLDLVRAVAGESLPLEEVIALEREALAETGNIILNGCLATIANMLHRKLKVSLPEIVYGTGAEIFSRGVVTTTDPAVLFLYVNFSVHHRDIQGNIAMLMDLPSLLVLKSLIGQLIARASGEPDTDHAIH
jgi:chemotaxis protein CheC